MTQLQPGTRPFDPEYGKYPLLLAVHSASAEARRARCPTRDALLHRQDVPGGIQEQYVHRPAWLLEPYHQAGLRCLSRSAGRQVQQAGRQKAQVCVACHGPAGNSTNPVMPSLPGQPSQFISMEPLQVREGKRKDPQMTPMAANLSNADLNDLAAYFSAQKPKPPEHRTDPANAAAAPKLAQKFYCVQCHGPALLVSSTFRVSRGSSSST